MRANHMRALSISSLLFLSKEPGDDVPDFVYVAISVVLVVIAGLMSGLTLGLLSLDTVDMEMLKRCGTDQEKKYAKSVANLISNPHFLLCTLLIWNAACMEALPIFLDRLADPVTAVILSVTVVLIFGEILPQSICTRYGLAVGYYTKWLLLVFMTLTYPIAYPLGRLLDAILGHGAGVFRNRGQIKEYMNLHAEDVQLGGELTQFEVGVIQGALDLTSKTAITAMTPLDKVFMLSHQQVLDHACIRAILEKGHSRIPVYGSERHDVQGVLLVKELLKTVISADGQVRTVGDIPLRSLPRLSSATPMYEVLQLFKTGRAHMALLCTLSPEDRQVRQSVSVRFSASTPLIRSNSGNDVPPEPTRELQRSSSSDAGTCSMTAPLLGPARQPSPILEHNGSHDGRNGSMAGSTTLVEIAVEEQEEQLAMDADYGAPVGIVTIEDVIEELIGTEIIDETDQWMDNEQTTRVAESDLTSELSPMLRRVLNVALFKVRASQGANPTDSRRGGRYTLSDFGPYTGIAPNNRKPARSQVVHSPEARRSYVPASEGVAGEDIEQAAQTIQAWAQSTPGIQKALQVISTAVRKSDSHSAFG